VARAGSGTFVVTNFPKSLTRIETTYHPTDTPREAAFSLGRTSVDSRAWSRFRSFLAIRMRTIQAQDLQYGDPMGGWGFRGAIADYLLAERGLKCHREQIMLVSGALNGLQIVLSSILKHRQSICLEDPGYPVARAVMNQSGLTIIRVSDRRVRYDRGDRSRARSICKSSIRNPY
jgi:GntR family transcriptional regulator / MocR family aminotransferase